MAFGRGTELILFLRAQNRASATLRRVSGDVRALTKVRDLDMRAERLAIQQAGLAERQAANIAKLRERGFTGTGRASRAAQMGATQAALEGRQIRLAQQRAKLERSLGPARVRNIQEQVKQLGYHNAALTTAQRKVAQLMVAEQGLTAAMRANKVAAQGLVAENAALARQSAQLAIAQNELKKRMPLVQVERMAYLAQHLGRVLVFAGAVGTAAFAASANAAANFARNATLVATQTGKVGSGMGQVVQNSKELQAAFLQVGSDSTSSLEDINDSAYNLFSTIDTLGDQGSAGLQTGAKMLKLFSDAAIGGLTETGVVTEGVISVFSAFDEIPPTVENTRMVLDRMFSAVRYGRVTFAEFAESLETTAPAAVAAGQGFHQMAADLAFLSRPLGIEKARVGYARLLEILTRGKMVAGLKKMGVNVADAAGNVKPLIDIITEIDAKRGDLKQSELAVMQFFKAAGNQEGTIQARRAFSVLIRNLEDYRRVQGKVTDEQGAMNRAVSAMSATDAVKFQKALRQLRVLWIQIGVAALPVIVQLLSGVKELLDWFASLDQGTKNIVVRFMAIGAVATLTLGALSLLAGALASLVISLKILNGRFAIFGGKKGAAGAAGAAGKLASEVGRTRVEFVLIAGSIVALIPFMDDLTDSTNNLEAALKLVEVALTALALRGLVVFAGKAIAGRLALAGLTTLIGGIGALSAAQVVGIGALSFAVMTLMRKLPHWEEDWKNVGGAIYDAFHQEPGPQDTSSQMQSQIALMKDKFKELRDMGLTPDTIRFRLQDIFPEMDENQFDIFFNSAANAYKRGAAKLTQEAAKAAEQIRDRPGLFEMFPEKAAQALPDMIDGIYRDEIFQIVYKRVEALREAAEKAPTFANWARYHRALKELQKHSGDAQVSSMEAVTAASDEAAEAIKEAAEATKQYRKELVNVARQARETAERELSSAASNLTQIFERFREDNQNLFGELFSGPWLDSEFGQTADKWGIEPRIQDLTKDLQMQLREFNNFNGAMATLAARGAPAELLNELKALGPDALGKIQMLTKAAPGEFNKFVAVWKTKQAAIEEATKIDFDKQLAQWFSYGKGIAQQIIFGLRSENVALDEAFKKYLTAKFPNYVSEAIAKAQAEVEKPTTTTGQPRPVTTPKPATVVNQTDNSTVTVNAGRSEGADDASRKAVHLWKSGLRKHQAKWWGIPEGTGR
jgi:TP901 family phage tail tape measure protein